MSKINIKYILENVTTKDIIKNERKGILKNNQIIFFDDNIKVTICLYSNKIKMTRQCDDYNLEMNFEKFLTINGFYDIKDIGVIDIKIKTLNLLIKNNQIFLEYKMYLDKEKNLFKYDLEYEVIE